MKINAIRSLLATTALATSALALAATDGGAGNTSTGDLLVTLNVTQLISVGGLNDLTLDNSNDFQAADDICVGQIGGVTDFSVDFSGANAAGGNQFLLDDGTGNTLSYRVFFDNDADASDGTEADAGNGAVTPTGTYTTMGALGCGDGVENSQILVQIDPSELLNATNTSYTDTLTVTVTAN
ncbi:hypothetical protein [Microbulbifer sp. SAOS-129_SWC]|uniref:hypothetical protein n=1 Tax=Microbulbifer sp. SAOS-129_SWC TaxID=3145235 RepID=UPI003217C9E4